jgi:hypothetical protein
MRGGLRRIPRLNQRTLDSKKGNLTLDRVSKFWADCGFVQLPDSEFYAHSLELLKQPDPIRIA